MDVAPVIVGYHGTDACRAAVLWALRHAAPDQPVIAVAALGHERARFPGLPGEHSRGVDRLTAAWVQDGDGIDEEVELVVRRGRPSDVLDRVARERGAALIVVGHERHRAGGLHPSVALHLATGAGCPVTVV